MRLSLLAPTLPLLLLQPSLARAQSTPAAQTTPSPASPPSQGASEPLEGVVAPRPIDMPLDYPEGASGDARVLLELLIEADGSVGDARAVEGDAPFTDFAARSARAWRFEPARQRGEARAARIRLEVTFTQPLLENEASKVPSAATPAATPAAPVGRATRAATTPPSGASNDSAPSGDTEILVGGDRPESTHQRSRAEVRLLPGAFGDPFRAVESLPGVTPIVSGLPYFYVRGAPPGNVGYYLDDVRIPILFHVGAGPSVIHPAFIENVELYAGPYPARYGRFMGGIVAGHTAEPRYETRAEASIRLVDAGAMVETHALDNSLSVMLGGRYSYTAAIISLVAPEIDLSYWDYQGRAQYRLSGDETLTLFGFGSLDNATEERPNGEKISIFDLIFHRLNLRYKRALDDGGFWELSALGGVDITAGDEDDGLSMQDRLLGVGLRLERPLAKNLLLRAGVDVQADRYSVHLEKNELDSGGSGPDGRPPSDDMPPPGVTPPPEVSEEDEEARLEEMFPSRTDIVTGAQLDLVWEPEPGVRVTPGTRFDIYFSSGHAFLGVEPRISAAFDVGERFTLHHGLGVVNQMPSFVIPLPGVQPSIGRGLQHAVQHSAGVETHLGAGIDATATVYQNIQTNLTDVLSTIHTDEEIDPDDDVRGMGSGRGLEILVERPLSMKLGGYLSYTLAYTQRSVGRYSGPSSFDRRHVLGAALGYQLGAGWIFGARGTYYTGIPGSVSNVEYSEPAPVPGAPAPMQPTVQAINLFSVPRTEPFWRLDWRLEKRWSIGTQGQWWSIVAEVLNTTLNKEMISRDCGNDGCHAEVVGPVTIPSIGVEASL
jgi:hypothetical protein